jgi:hypothetical protein
VHAIPAGTDVTVPDPDPAATTLRVVRPGLLATTVIDALAVLPSTVAETVVVPGLIPVSRPFADTAAIPGFDVDHVTAVPVITWPVTSRAVATSC